MKNARPVSAPLFFQACGMPRGMNTHVPGPPELTLSPTLKLYCPLRTYITSSLSRWRWNGVAVRGGVISSNAITLCPVCSFCNLSAAVLPGAMFHTGSCPGSVTKLSVFMSSSSVREDRDSTRGTRRVCEFFDLGDRKRVVEYVLSGQYSFKVGDNVSSGGPGTC